MSDTMGNLYGKSQGELSITKCIVPYLTFSELLRLSYSCKRAYIVMGDLRVLSRFSMNSKAAQARNRNHNNSNMKQVLKN